MGGMPYHLEKGPWFSVVEDYLNSITDEEMLVMLAQLRAGRPLWEFEYVGAETLSGGRINPLRALKSRVKHMAVEWFGRERRPDGTYAPRPEYDDAATTLQDTRADLRSKVVVARREYDAARANGASTGDRVALRETFATAAQEYASKELFASTGYWSGYSGNVEEIMRVSRIRAIEVALGLPSNPLPPPDESSWEGLVKNERYQSRSEDVTRRLPIEYLWKCPQRWFEAWISWRVDPDPYGSGPEQGQVTVILCTPGVGSPVLDRIDQQATTIGEAPAVPLPPPPHEAWITARQRQNAPRRATSNGGFATRGMWVVAHEDHDIYTPTPAPAEPSGKGEWIIPHFGPCFQGLGKVKVCAPNEGAGGVNIYGLPWDPVRLELLYPNRACH
jgi:hypothetical protein